MTKKMLGVFILLLSMCFINSNDIVKANNEYCGITKYEDGSIEYITYDEYHKYDSATIETISFDASTYSVVQPPIIGGEDTRVQITKEQSKLFPYSAVCAINGYFDSNEDGIEDVVYKGTGALVGPSTILTKSTLVYDNNYGWHKRIEVIPGQYITDDGELDEDCEIYTHIKAASIGNHHNTGSPNDAWSILDLGDNIGEIYGYYGVTYTDISLGSEIRMYSYHSDYNMNMAEGTGYVNMLETYKFYHSCDYSSNGNDGAPLMTGKATLVGINYGIYDSINHAACKVSSFIANWVHERTTPEEVSNEENNNNSRLIFNVDERVTINSAQYTKFPYRAICVVLADYDLDGDNNVDSSSVGTGSLVGPSTVLTCAHLFVNTSERRLINIRVIPGGYKSNTTSWISPNGIFNYSAISIGSNALTGKNDDDWAIIDLENDIGSTLGYFGLSSTSINVGTKVRLYGYHGDIPNKISYGPGNITYLETYKFYHNCDAWEGSSGGPITFGNVTVVGIHSGGVDSTQDAACKVSSYIVQWIYNRIL